MRCASVVVWVLGVGCSISRFDSERRDLAAPTNNDRLCAEVRTVAKVTGTPSRSFPWFGSSQTATFHFELAKLPAATHSVVLVAVPVGSWQAVERSMKIVLPGAQVDAKPDRAVEVPVHSNRLLIDVLVESGSEPLDCSTPCELELTVRAPFGLPARIEQVAKMFQTSAHGLTRPSQALGAVVDKALVDRLRGDLDEADCPIDRDAVDAWLETSERFLEVARSFASTCGLTSVTTPTLAQCADSLIQLGGAHPTLSAVALAVGARPLKLDPPVVGWASLGAHLVSLGSGERTLDLVWYLWGAEDDLPTASEPLGALLRELEPLESLSAEDLAARAARVAGRVSGKLVLPSGHEVKVASVHVAKLPPCYGPGTIIPTGTDDGGEWVVRQRLGVPASVSSPADLTAMRSVREEPGLLLCKRCPPVAQSLWTPLIAAITGLERGTPGSAKHLGVTLSEYAAATGQPEAPFRQWRVPGCSALDVSELESKLGVVADAGNKRPLSAESYHAALDDGSEVLHYLDADFAQLLRQRFSKRFQAWLTGRLKSRIAQSGASGLTEVIEQVRTVFKLPANRLADDRDPTHFAFPPRFVVLPETVDSVLSRCRDGLELAIALRSAQHSYGQDIQIPDNLTVPDKAPSEITVKLAPKAQTTEVTGCPTKESLALTVEIEDRSLFDDFVLEIVADKKVPIHLNQISLTPQKVQGQSEYVYRYPWNSGNSAKETFRIGSAKTPFDPPVKLTIRGRGDLDR